MVAPDGVGGRAAGAWLGRGAAGRATGPAGGPAGAGRRGPGHGAGAGRPHIREFHMERSFLRGSCSAKPMTSARGRHH